MEVATFIREALQLTLLSVPGIHDKNNAILRGKGITSTHQLIGQYMLFHSDETDVHQLHNRYSTWLCKLGITENSELIASVVAQKVGTWVDAVYEADSESWDLCTDVGGNSKTDLQSRWMHTSAHV